MDKILVIDDEQSIRDAFELALMDESYEVVTAVDGLDGLKKFEEVQPDLIFLDLKMPRMNGVEALKEIRKLNAKVPIFIVTAFAREFMEELDAITELGFEFELAAKPMNANQICQIAKVVLSR